MPTYEASARFQRDYQRLSPAQQQQFLAALQDFIATLREWEQTRRTGAPRFPPTLGIKRMVGHQGVMEFAWAADGRCTWEYGDEVLPEHFHIVWRRIGSHDIYNDP